ncbi:NUDIX hydrolase [Oceanobacillus salinisoli]|uniref:NUDIX hydrolase n=1 Tax=Oceanobacillus salinisoli TaxID=2678611 RepID=UPI0012E1055F|nr:NUDIX domain-containing protein [Oceanobacillus salinisoli]
MEKKLIVVVKGFVIYDGKVLLVKRAMHNKIGGGNWELPGGKLKVGEDLEETLVREIEEETGLVVKPDKILYASTINDDPNRQLVFLQYLCRANSDVIQLSEEHTDVCWATKDVIRELLHLELLHDFEKHGIFALEDLQ